MHNTLLAVGWIDTGRSLGTQFESLLITVGVPVLATLAVLITWSKTRSGPAALGAIILGAIVWWGVANMGLLANKTGDDINNNTNGYSVSSTSGSGTTAVGGTR
ncbi:MAG: hypothetical protein HOY69_38695 [Streptomyces sp.]|nr:hypothetical protein [Streptomyces sp.]